MSSALLFDVTSVRPEGVYYEDRFLCTYHWSLIEHYSGVFHKTIVANQFETKLAGSGQLQCNQQSCELGKHPSFWETDPWLAVVS